MTKAWPSFETRFCCALCSSVLRGQPARRAQRPCAPPSPTSSPVLPRILPTLTSHPPRCTPHVIRFFGGPSALLQAIMHRLFFLFFWRLSLPTPAQRPADRPAGLCEVLGHWFNTGWV